MKKERTIKLKDKKKSVKGTVILLDPDTWKNVAAIAANEKGKPNSK